MGTHNQEGNGAPCSATQMKLAVFFSNNPTSGWNMGAGIVRTLQRMGHETIGIPTPTERETTKEVIAAVKRAMPTPAMLQAQDAIIVSGPEHLSPWLDAVYDKHKWKNITAPKACWLHESCSRDDYSIDFDAIKWCGDEWFFPAIQDAEFYDQEMFAAGRSHWLPFGVDTQIFKPLDVRQGMPASGKVFDIGFLGLLYPKRQTFLRALAHHKHPTIHCGMCMIQDMRGYDLEGSMRLLAANTREIKVFLNLPSMSRLLVAKIYETMACGTFLMTPDLPESALGNMNPFEHGKHLAFYSPSNLALCAQRLREWVSPEKDEERQRIAEAGCAEVHRNHSLMQRLAELLMHTRVKEAVQ